MTNAASGPYHFDTKTEPVSFIQMMLAKQAHITPLLVGKPFPVLLFTVGGPRWIKPEGVCP